MTSRYVTGYIDTLSKDCAASARFAFFAYLDKPSFNTEDYVHYRNTSLSKGGGWYEYRISFTNVPIEIWGRFCTVWVNENAYYPYQCGAMYTLHEQLRNIS